MSLFNQLLNPDLFRQIQAFQRPSYWRNFCPKEQAYWKNRFSRDIIPQLDKGYRLVEFSFDLDGNYTFCTDCYQYGLCYADDYGIDPQTIEITIDHVSYETFSQHAENMFWNLEQYKVLSKTLYGRYAISNWSGCLNDLNIQIRSNRAKIFFENDLESMYDYDEIQNKYEYDYDLDYEYFDY
jgi:predicted GNAT superfamily acetyltransferase